MLTALTTKALQPQLAHATRFVARSSPLTKANKKDPSYDESSLWSGRRGSGRIIGGLQVFIHKILLTQNNCSLQLAHMDEFRSLCLLIKLDEKVCS